MNTRIRYSKPTNGVMQSRRNFALESGIEVNVELNTNTKTYRILDAVTRQELATGGNTRNISVLKIQAKDGLVKMGVTFEEEKRERGQATSGS